MFVPKCRGNITLDASGLLIVGGAIEMSSGSRSESEHELVGTRDVPRFGALRGDNTPTPAMMTMIKWCTRFLLEMSC